MSNREPDKTEGPAYVNLQSESPNRSVLRVSYKDPLAVEKIAGALNRLAPGINDMGRLRAVLCIGSDRSTGDALGPLVGTRLQSFLLPATLILGTLAEPVHALNLGSRLGRLQAEGCSWTIAVDASLGKPGHVGLIEVGDGPLYPGAGVHKKLPPAGQIYISGIVNLGGFMEQMVLQSTRLYRVIELADVIAEGIRIALLKDAGAEASRSPSRTR